MKFSFLFLWTASFTFLISAGTPPVPSAITATPKLILYSGWNLIAPPSNFSFHTRNIENIIGSDIYFFDSKIQSWKSGVNLSIPPGVGLWVNVSKGSKILYKTSIRNPFKIVDFEVTKGWNLLGMSLDSERINIIAIKHNAKSIFVYNANISQWINYRPYSRDSLKAGMGFWLETN
jgi:hypothetical protein